MRRLAISALFSALAFAAHADPTDGLDGTELRALVQDAMSAAGVAGRIEIASLRSYPACDDLPSVAPRQGNWRTVELTCAAPHWQRALRTEAAGRAMARSIVNTTQEGTGIALALTQSLTRGTVITAEHVELVPANTEHLPGELNSIEAAIGRTLLVNLGESRILQARHLDHNYLVSEGNVVSIHAGLEGFSVSTGGIAMENGQLGERISVRNARSGRILQVVVTDANNVTVAPNMN